MMDGLSEREREREIYTKRNQKRNFPFVPLWTGAGVLVVALSRRLLSTSSGLCWFCCCCLFHQPRLVFSIKRFPFSIPLTLSSIQGSNFVCLRSIDFLFLGFCFFLVLFSRSFAIFLLLFLIHPTSKRRNLHTIYIYIPFSCFRYRHNRLWF